MAKDARALREEAAEATATGKYKRALAAYLELERIEPRDAQWAKRAGETYKRLGNLKHAVEAFERSADRYAQNGFLVQAIAVCKLILQIQPQHADTLRRLAQMNAMIGQGPTRVAGLAENNPALHELPNVAAIRRASTSDSIANKLPAELQQQYREDSQRRRRADPSSPPPWPQARTKSRPIALIPGAALDSVKLSQEIPLAHPRDQSTPGIHVIPIDEETDAMGGWDPASFAGGAGGRAPREINEAIEGSGSVEIDTYELGHTTGPIIEIEPPDDGYDPPAPTARDELLELELDDLEEIPLPEPRAIGAAAQRALASTPLFAGLPSDVLEALVENLALVPLERNEMLFRQGDPGDALYVVVEGELTVHHDAEPDAQARPDSRLGPGSFIGEVALMTEQPRSATVTALTTCELLRIDRVTLSRVLGSHGDLLRAVLRFVRDRLVDRWMRTSPLFRPFDDAQRAELAARFSFLEIDADTTLLGAGVRPDGLYIVLAGTFVVVRGNAVVASLGPGDLIGETALLSGGAFRSDVVSRGKSLALCLPARDFREVIMTHPHVLEYVGEQAEHSRRLHIL